jgi:hypothetical protein
MSIKGRKVEVTPAAHARLRSLSTAQHRSMGSLVDEWALQADDDAKLQSLRAWRRLDDTLLEILAEMRKVRSAEQEFLATLERVFTAANAKVEKAAEKLPNRLEAAIAIIRQNELDGLKRDREFRERFENLEVLGLEMVLRQRVGQALASRADLNARLREVFSANGLEVPEEV